MTDRNVSNEPADSKTPFKLAFVNLAVSSLALQMADAEGTAALKELAKVVKPALEQVCRPTVPFIEALKQCIDGLTVATIWCTRRIHVVTAALRESGFVELLKQKIDDTGAISFEDLEAVADDVEELMHPPPEENDEHGIEAGGAPDLSDDKPCDKSGGDKS